MALAVHLSVFLPFGCSGTTQEEKPNRSHSDAFQGHIETKFIPMAPGSQQSCPGYSGIGIKSLGVVWEVSPGSPAEEVGLKAGDTIINDEVLGRDRYEVGHLLKLIVEDPYGKKRQLLVRTAWICEDSQSGPAPSAP